MKVRLSWQWRNHQPARSNFFLDRIAKSREVLVLKQKTILSLVPFLIITRAFKTITRLERKKICKQLFFISAHTVVLNIFFCYLPSFHYLTATDVFLSQEISCFLCSWWQGSRLRLRISSRKGCKGWSLDKEEPAVATLPFLVSPGDHVHCTQQGYPFPSRTGVFQMDSSGTSGVIWPQLPWRLCKFCTRGVKQQETQISSCVKVLSSQVWSANDGP